MICFVTAIYDDYDDLKELPAQDVETEAICVTDNPDLQSETWTIVHEPSRLEPVRAAKRPKFRPWLYTDAEYTIWVDASMRMTSWSTAEDLIKYAEPLAQFKHPDRDCLYTEATYSVETCPKYVNEPLLEQTDVYRAQGHPERWGLWACGVIVRRYCAEMLELGERWAAEVDRWSFQDQVSYPKIVRDLGVRPVELPGSYLANDNPWLRYEGSVRH